MTAKKAMQAQRAYVLALLDVPAPPCEGIKCGDCPSRSGRDDCLHLLIRGAVMREGL